MKININRIDPIHLFILSIFVITNSWTDNTFTPEGRERERERERERVLL